jgi:hypothetical protein
MFVTLVSLLGASIWTLVISLMMVTSFIYSCHKYQWFDNHNAIINIERNLDNQWTLFDLNGVQQSNLELISSVVTQQCVMLNFASSTSWKKKTVTIMSDSVDAECFRQLRVYCREAKTFPK